jgi:thiamine biosynthesis protein ThiC
MPTPGPLPMLEERRDRFLPPTAPADGPCARDPDDALSYDHYPFDSEKQFALSLEPETVRSMQDQTLPDDYYKGAALLLCEAPSSVP